MIAVAAAEFPVVEDVPGRLLEVRGKTAPLEDLREDVRRLLACDVGPAQLCNGVVSELRENPVVQTPGFFQANCRVAVIEDLGDGPHAQIGLGYELVEEEASDRVG